MKKSELKFLKLKVNREHLRKWGKFFYCPVFQQYTCLAVCHHRAFVLSKDFDHLKACKNCMIRKHSFRVIRRPRLIVRKPRRA